MSEEEPQRLTGLNFRISQEEEPEPQIFWDEDGKLRFLEMLAQDPDSHVTKLADGVYMERDEPDTQ